MGAAIAAVARPHLGAIIRRERLTEAVEIGKVANGQMGSLVHGVELLVQVVQHLLLLFVLPEHRRHPRAQVRDDVRMDFG